MNVIELPVDMSTLITAAIGAIFLVMLVASFLYLLISFLFQSKRVEQQLSLIRIIGGMSVLLFALATGNSYIQFASLFIGGLLIASENFLVHLAAIFKSNGEKVPDVMQSYRHLSPDEIATKQTLEISESAAAEVAVNIDSETGESADSENEDDEGGEGDPGLGGPSTSGGNATEPKIDDSKAEETKLEQRKKLSARLKRYAAATNMALSIVENNIIGSREMLRKLISLQVNDRTFRLDGIVIERNTNRIVSALEVKYFRTLNVGLAKSVLNSQVKWFDGVDYNLVFILVVEEYDYDKINELLKYRNELKENGHNIGLMIYQLSTSSIGEKLDILNDEDKLMVSDNILLRF